MSIVFSWVIPQAKLLAKEHKGKVIVGGPAVYSNPELFSWAKIGTNSIFDVLSMHNPFATFTTRGCIRKCKFCAVPKIEGEFKELKKWKPAPLICDNNITASSKKHFEKVIKSLKKFPLVDFNQGLDCRLFTKWHTDQLCNLKSVIVRFAFDHINNESKMANAIQLVKKAGFKDIRIYVLVGFKDNPKEALYKLEWVRKQACLPFPQRYNPLDIQKQNSFISKRWTDYELKKICRYYSNLKLFRNFSYKEYHHSKKEYKEGFGLV